MCIRDSDNNEYFFAGGENGSVIKFGDVSFEQWQKRGQDAHSIVADPLFVDPTNGDFSLQPNSPALKIGFEPIDIRSVGPRATR